MTCTFNRSSTAALPGSWIPEGKPPTFDYGQLNFAERAIPVAVIALAIMLPPLAAWLLWRTL